MLEKTKEKEESIKLREKGLSYREILEKVPVAKSTLSLWLRDVGLTKRQKQRLTEKKLAAMKRGWEACHQKKIRITEEIIRKAKKDIGKLSKREAWLIGVGLYWAEGQKERRKGSLVNLGNSDPEMILFFLKWIYQNFKIKKEDLVFRIYLHETSVKRLKEVRAYWSKKIGLSEEYLQKVTWKKNKIKTNRKNIAADYYGLLNVKIKRSTNLNRKIKGWTEGICQKN